MLQAAAGNAVPKYCANCGRLISPNHRNFAERKYCSKTCGSRRLSGTDKSLEKMFVDLATQRGSVGCDEVQRLYGEELGNTTTAAVGAEVTTMNDTDKHKAGLDVAAWRERVRRAARRVVVFPRADEQSFECVQKGKAVEPSFAKGDWAVRHVKR